MKRISVVVLLMSALMPATLMGQTQGALIQNVPALSKAAADGFYVNVGGDTMTGTLDLPSLRCSVCTHLSSVASGGIAWSWDTDVLFSAGTLYQWKEGGSVRMSMGHQGNMTLNSDLIANDQIRNSSSTSGCGVSNGKLCLFDEVSVDGALFLLHQTTPTPQAGSVVFFGKTDDRPYFEDDDGVVFEIRLLETFHADMSASANGTAFNISAALQQHCYHSASLSSTDLQGFTFTAGGGGVSVPIASIADGGGGEIAVTTTGVHSLAVGDIISQTNLTDTDYRGVFQVNAINSTTIYEVTAPFTATDTGQMDECAGLIADASSAGDYHMMWTASVTNETNNETFDFDVHLDEAVVAASEVRLKLRAQNDFNVPAGADFIPITGGQQVSFLVENQDSAGDITIRNISFHLVRL